MSPLPIGIQSFEKLRRKGYLYVDKTKLIMDLLESGSHIFLSRPRRFGKSLLLSTLECIFDGKSNLFNNLYISRSSFDWEEWNVPCLTIDLTLAEYHRERDDLEHSLMRILHDQGLKHGIDLDPQDYYLKEYFHAIVKSVHEATGKQVAVLVDEYDKPIVENINDLDKAREHREVLREFYGVLKPLDKYLQFVLLTGVSKFSRVSLFSGLNNLEDITLDSRFATICGITPEEVGQYLRPHLLAFSQSLNLNVEQAVSMLQKWYDGYSWDGHQRVYNPHSLFLTLKKHQFYPFWFDTGTPMFLINLIEKMFTSSDSVTTFVEPLTVNMEILDAFDVETIDLVALLFQTGYLTIKKLYPQIRTIELGFPNLEVKESFLSHLFALNASVSPSRTRPLYLELLDLLEKKQHDQFCKRLQALIAGIPHVLHVPKEAYYHSLFYILFELLGCHVEAEVLTSKGRLDVVIFLNQATYIIEFKYGGSNAARSARSALNQIQKKQYHVKYLHESSSKSIILLGLAIDHDRNLACAVEEVSI